jgi:hypothetical protein
MTFAAWLFGHKNQSTRENSLIKQKMKWTASSKDELVQLPKELAQKKPIRAVRMGLKYLFANTIVIKLDL